MEPKKILRPCHDCGADTGEYGLQPSMKFMCPACKIKQLGHNPRVLTVEESRARFLDHILTMLHYWETESRVPDLHGKMEGFAFSMLVMLDGGSGDMPGFIVAPQGTKADQKFHKSIGEDWWPYVSKGVEAKIKSDIAGGLHDEFGKVCEKWKKEKVVEKFEKWKEETIDEKAPVQK
jgi:hypothetical protein